MEALRSLVSSRGWLRSPMELGVKENFLRVPKGTEAI